MDSENALQILRHCVAFIGNECRMRRKEGEQLLVPPGYLAFYDAAVMMLRNELTKRVDVIEISAEDVKIRLKNAIKVLLTYESWGRLDHHVHDEVMERNVSLPELPTDRSMYTEL